MARLGAKSLLFALIFISSSIYPASAEEISIDALAPGNIANCSSPISGLYGNTVIAGTTTTIIKLEFITQSYMVAPANSIQVKVSTGGPMSASGTLVGTFSQSSVVSSPSDGGDKYRITFTGSANVIQGTTYYIQPSYVTSNVSQNLCLSSNSYSASGGWSLPMSGSNYIDVWSTGTFNWFAYHKFRITTGEILTTATINSLQLAGNTKVATFGKTMDITVNVAVPSKVTFLANNKRIPRCLHLATTGTAPNITVTCKWKPSTKGSVVIVAKAIPNDSALSGSTSSPLIISTVRRTDYR